MKYVLILLSLVAFGCQQNAAGPAAGGSAAAASESRTIATSSNTVYTWEITGAGIIFSTDLHGYANAGHTGFHENQSYATVVQGATATVYTLTAKSMIANITLNNNAGTLTIVTKKNGAVLRTDTITANGVNISMNDSD